MTTKERIIDESLTLFSTKGFKGTSVKNIADAVGIKDASLYKHFKSKQQILDTIVETMQKHIGMMSDEMGLPSDDDMESQAAVYADFDENMLVDLSKKVFMFYLTDQFMSRFWKMGMMEQFQNPDVYEVFRSLFLEDSITYQTALFTQMQKNNVLTNKADAKVMAIYFYTPIFFLLNKYVSIREKADEALDVLDKQVREFLRIYKKE